MLLPTLPSTAVLPAGMPTVVLNSPLRKIEEHLQGDDRAVACPADPVNARLEHVWTSGALERLPEPGLRDRGDDALGYHGVALEPKQVP